MSATDAPVIVASQTDVLQKRKHEDTPNEPEKCIKAESPSVFIAWERAKFECRETTNIISVHRTLHAALMAIARQFVAITKEHRDQGVSDDELPADFFDTDKTNDQILVAAVEMNKEKWLSLDEYDVELDQYQTVFYVREYRLD